MKVLPSAFFVVSAVALMGADNIPIGHLGHPLGKYLTIEGVRGFKSSMDARQRNKIKDARSLEVDTIDGKKLDRPIRLWLKNAAFGKEQRYVLRGYETGGMTGMSPEVIANEKEFAEKYPQQGAFYLRTEFVVTSVKEPEGVQLKKKRTGLDFSIPDPEQETD